MVFKEGGEAGLQGLQAAPMGLTDQTESITPPWPVAGNPNSKFQAVLFQDLQFGRGFGVEMHLKSGATNNNGNHIDFDLGNQATNGLPGLHSHHELFMNSHSGTYSTSFVLRFTAAGVRYVLSYQLRPRNNATKAGAPPGIDWFNDENEPDGLERYVTLDATYFGTPHIDGNWTNVEIDWAGLALYVRNIGLWPELDINQATGWCGLQFYETVYGPKGTQLGGIDVFQRNWVMGYQ